MKTIRFVREHNTFNEYTCDCLEDCTGDFLKKDDVLALLQRIDDQIALEEADASTWSMGSIITARRLLEQMRASIE